MSKKDASGLSPIVQIGRTPAGQIATETPRSSRPSMTRTWGGMFEMLGDPTSRYGRLVAGTVSMSTKLKMLTDPVIALSVAYIGSKLVKAEYEVQCADAHVKRFIEAVYGAFHREFMTQAAMAVALGCCGLIKKLRFEAPSPLKIGDPPTWTGASTPLICTGFDQADPATAYPDFEDGEFTGFHHGGGAVDRVYALWLTIGRAKAFGKYSGTGRLNQAYKAWWLGEFGYDQMAVHVQKFVDRSIIVGHPWGKDDAGNDLSDTALDIGNDLRSGATIAMPTEVYPAYEETSGMKKLTAIRKWTIELLEAAENIGAFVELADHCDSRKALGMLIPFQLYQQVKQSSLGGPTTSDVLGKLAVDLIIEDATEIDLHLNEYLFPYLVDVNFGQGAALARKVTTGLNEYDRGELFELLKILASRMDGETATLLDAGGLAHRLDVPTRSSESVEPEPGPEPERNVQMVGADVDAPTVDSGVPAGDDQGNMPREVLEHLLSEPPLEDDDQAAVITEADIERVRKALEDFPEIEALKTVEVVERKEDEDAGA